MARTVEVTDVAMRARPRLTSSSSSASISGVDGEEDYRGTTMTFLHPSSLLSARNVRGVVDGGNVESRVYAEVMPWRMERGIKLQNPSLVIVKYDGEDTGEA